MSADDVQCHQYSLNSGTLFFYDKKTGKNTSAEVVGYGLWSVDCGEKGLSEELSRALSNTCLLKSPFRNGSVPIQLTSSAMTVTAFLLLVLLFIARKRRPILQKLAAATVTASMTYYIWEITSQSRRSHNQGYSNPDQLRSFILTSDEFQVLEVVTQFLIWLAHIQVIDRFYGKKKYRKTVIAVAASLTVFNAIIWGVLDSRRLWAAKHHVTSNVFGNGLMVFGYTFITSSKFFFAVFIIYCSILRRPFAYHRGVYFLATLSIATLLCPCAMFALQAKSEIFAGFITYIRLVSDMASNVVSWEWLDVIEQLEQESEAKGFLGRRLYNRSDSNAFFVGASRFQIGRGNRRDESSTTPGDDDQDRDEIQRVKSNNIRNPSACDIVVLVKDDDRVVEAVSKIEHRSPAVRLLPHSRLFDRLRNSAAQLQDVFLQFNPRSSNNTKVSTGNSKKRPRAISRTATNRSASPLALRFHPIRKAESSTTQNSDLPVPQAIIVHEARRTTVRGTYSPKTTDDKPDDRGLS